MIDIFILYALKSRSHTKMFYIIYIAFRLLPVLWCHLYNKNPNHDYKITFVAETLMLLDDIGLMEYETAKLLGGIVFGIEKVIGYDSHRNLSELRKVPLIISALFGLLLVMSYDTKFTNILYLVVMINWFYSACATALREWKPYHILGACLYAITDFDVAIYDCGIFGIALLPVYQAGLVLLTL